MMRVLLKRRTFVWLAGALILLTLGMLAEMTRPYPYLQEVLENPQEFDGRLISLLVECRVAEVTADGFVLQQMDASIPAVSADGNFQKGDYVVVEGIFRAPAKLEVTRIRVAQGRTTKIAISVAPVIVVMILLIKNIGFDKKVGRFFLEIRSHA